jgi:hypothetical protein
MKLFICYLYSMKKYLSLAFLTCLFINKANAQVVPKYYIRTDTVVRVIVTHNKEYLIDSNYFKKFIKIKELKEMIIGYRESPDNDTSKYGRKAVNGVSKFIIDDQHYPKLYAKQLT